MSSPERKIIKAGRKMVKAHLKRLPKCELIDTQAQAEERARMWEMTTALDHAETILKRRDRAVEAVRGILDDIGVNY
tara:strand:+ start:800 stop:1030 length:231 start_codon:yes stop_codon:yes gene_type:complete